VPLACAAYRRDNPLISAGVALLLGLGACRSPSPAAEPGPSASADRREGAGQKRDDAPADPLLRAIHAQAAQLAPHMVPEDPPIRVRLEAGQRHAALAVLASGRCFKIFGAGGEGVETLNLVLFDEQDVRIQQAIGEGASPVLGAATSICPATPGAHRIEAHLAKGSGDIAIQIFRTEP
jgi:hypothetical protein